MPRRKPIPRRRLPVLVQHSKDQRPVPQGFIVLPEAAEVEWMIPSPHYNSITATKAITTQQAQHQGVHDVMSNNPESIDSWRESMQLGPFGQDCRPSSSCSRSLSSSLDDNSSSDDSDDDDDDDSNDDEPLVSEKKHRYQPRPSPKRRRLNIPSSPATTAQSLSNNKNNYQPAKRSRSDPLPKIGKKHQVDPDHIPDAGTHENDDQDDVTLLYHDMIWNPVRATPEVLSWLDTNPCFCNIDQKMLAMQALHESDYNVDAAREWLVKHHDDDDLQQQQQQQQAPPRLDQDALHQIFEHTKIGSEKKFGAIARQFHTSVAQVLVHYYRWKAMNANAYQRIFKTSNDCDICKDGGSLVVCSGTCKRAFHAKCLRLSSVPEGEWFCTECDTSTRNNGNSGAQQIQQQEWDGRIGFQQLDALLYILKIPVTHDKGLGLMIRQVAGRPILKEILRPDGPRGACPGDIIVAVDGVDIVEQPYRQVMAKLQAHNGQNVRTLTFQRPIIEIPSSDSSEDEESEPGDNNDDEPVVENQTKPNTGLPDTVDHALPFSMDILNDEFYLLRLPKSSIGTLMITEQDGYMLFESIGFQKLPNGPRFGDRLIAVDLVSVEGRSRASVMEMLSEMSGRAGCSLRFERVGGGLIGSNNCVRALTNGSPTKAQDMTVSSAMSSTSNSNREGNVESTSRSPSNSDLPITVIARPDNLYELHLPVTTRGLGLEIRNDQNGQESTCLSKVLRKVDDPDSVQPKQGDIIVRIDGTAVEGLSYKEIIALLKDHSGRSERIVVLKQMGASRPSPLPLAGLKPKDSFDGTPTSDGMAYTREKCKPSSRQYNGASTNTGPASSRSQTLSVSVSGQTSNANETSHGANAEHAPEPLSRQSTGTSAVTGSVSCHSQLLSASISDQASDMNGPSPGIEAEQPLKNEAPDAERSRVLVPTQKGLTTHSNIKEPQPKDKAQDLRSRASVKILNEREYELIVPTGSSDVNLKFCIRHKRVCFRSISQDFKHTAPKNGDWVVMVDGKDTTSMGVEEISKTIQTKNGLSFRTFRLCRNFDDRSKPNDDTNRAFDRQVDVAPISELDYQIRIPVVQSGCNLQLRKDGGKLCFGSLSLDGSEPVGPKAGDLIVEIDGVDATNLSTEDATQMLRNNVGKSERLIRLRRRIDGPLLTDRMDGLGNSENSPHSAPIMLNRSNAEYELELPVTKNGLGMVLKKWSGNVALERMNVHVDCSGLPGPESGDLIIAIDGELVEKWDFDRVRKTLKDNGGKIKRIVRFRRIF